MEVVFFFFSFLEILQLINLYIIKYHNIYQNFKQDYGFKKYLKPSITVHWFKKILPTVWLCLFSDIGKEWHYFFQVAEYQVCVRAWNGHGENEATSELSQTQLMISK